jgi:ribosomal protein S27E
VDLNLETESQMKVKCPEDCFSNQQIIYGHQKYSDQSSICTAALHSAVAKQNKTSYFVITVQEDSLNYPAIFGKPYSFIFFTLNQIIENGVKSLFIEKSL